jgi:hypothetical protein
MKSPKIHLPFTALLWKHSAPSGWYFVSLPVDLSKEIRQYAKDWEEGWGRLKVTAEIMGITWDTAIWFDTNHNTYLLPIKADIRKNATLEIEQLLTCSLYI